MQIIKKKKWTEHTQWNSFKKADLIEHIYGYMIYAVSFLSLKYGSLCVLFHANFDQSPWVNGHLESVKETLS